MSKRSRATRARLDEQTEKVAAALLDARMKEPSRQRPPMHNISTDADVPDSTVRKAVRLLEDYGLVRTTPGKGNARRCDLTAKGVLYFFTRPDLQEHYSDQVLIEALRESLPRSASLLEPFLSPPPFVAETIPDMGKLILELESDVFVGAPIRPDFDVTDMDAALSSYLLLLLPDFIGDLVTFIDTETKGLESDLDRDFKAALKAVAEWLDQLKEPFRKQWSLYAKTEDLRERFLRLSM
jgi:hypothetical protein